MSYMKQDTKSYTLRMPVVLLSRLDAYSRRNGMTQAQVVIQACREFLDPKKPYMIPSVGERNDVGAPRGGDGPPKPVLESSSLSTPAKVVDMAALRAICAGPGVVAEVTPEPVVEISICGKTWWEDGEHWECLMDLGHRELKHGMREMVRKLD